MSRSQEKSSANRNHRSSRMSRRGFMAVGAGAAAGPLTYSCYGTTEVMMKSDETIGVSERTSCEGMVSRDVSTPAMSACQAIEKALKAGQIGEPVAVRIVAHITAERDMIEGLTSFWLQAAAKWFGSGPKRLMSSGSLDSGQISTLTRFIKGQSALVSVGTSGLDSPALAVLVFGSRGTLFWEVTHRSIWLLEQDKRKGFVSGPRELLEAIRESLRTRQVAKCGLRKSENQGELKSTLPSGRVPILAPERWGTTAPRKAQNPPYGVLLVSGDHTHQPAYARSLAADKRCRLIGLTDETGVLLERKRLNGQLARRLGIPLLPSLQDALGREDVHIVSICAEPRRRGRIILQAAKAGKHLYLDKPLAGSLKDADAIAVETGKMGVVSHMFSGVREATALRVRELIESGSLGDLTAVHFDLSFAKGPAGTATLGMQRQEAVRPERFESRESKRELSNVGVYPVVMLMWLLGQKVRSVYAATGNYFFAEHQKNDMEDFGQMLLELESGVIATLAVGRTGWRSHPGSGLNRTYLIGSKGTAVVDAHRPRVEI